MRILILLVSSTALFACAGMLGTVEGANPGECADAADNDGDGTLDCDDSDCAADSACLVEGDADTDTDSDSDTDSDTDADLSATADWDSDGLRLDISGGSGTYLLGLAETGSGDDGWYGEDGVGGMGNFDIRHDAVSDDGISLETVTDPRTVQANSTTLFSDALKSGITYLLYANDDSGCWVWGHHADYYGDLDCTELDD